MAPDAIRATVWVVLTRSGLLSAIFASQELADQWIMDNPTVCQGCVTEPWHVHTERQEAAP